MGWRGLGVAERTAGNRDEAIAAWERAAATDPKDDFSILSLGQAYLEKGEKTRALAAFEKYLDLNREKLSPEERNRILGLIEKCR